MTALLPDSLFATNRRLWYCVAALVALDAAALLACGMELDFSRATLFFGVLALCALLSGFYRFVRRDDYLFFLGQITAQLLLAILSMGILSYIGQTLNLPLWDDTWIALDHALGFDWKSYAAWLDTKPLLAAIYPLAYFSSGPQVMVIVAMLFVCRQVSHIQRYIVALILTAMTTIFFATLLPSVGAFVYYDIDIANAYQHVRPAAGRIHEAPLMALRAGEMRTLVFPLEGLITFPSFHSALSILLMYASWPVRWLRLIILPLNVLVLFATPIDGGHWLVDVAGGVAIALACIGLTRRLLPSSRDTIPAAAH